jgi:hypothetical protein
MKTETSLWDDIRRTLKRKRQEWRVRRDARLRKGRRIAQNPRGFGPQTIERPRPEALEPGLDALRIWLILFALSGAALLIGVQFGGRFGLVIGFIATLLLNLWILFLSPTRITRALISWELEGRDTWGLLEAARRASELAHIPMPVMALSDSDDYFSLSVGISPSRSTIILSHALVEQLSLEERRLVVSFEVAKIACQWTASATAARGLMRLIDVPGLRYVTGRLLRFSLGRGRILKLDEWVASHGESREGWARTLWTLDAMTASKPRQSKASDSALDTVSAFTLTPRLKSRYDRALPNVRTRIGTLIDRYPP